MNRSVRPVFSCAFWLALWAVPLLGDEIRPAADAPKPRPPEESRSLFELPDGFRVDSVAAEPLLADPVAMAFDARGRIFVCEIHGYNLEGHYDIKALNATGVLDKTVRRIPASDEAIARAAPGQYGTVKLLEDTNGDGRPDRAMVWADHLPACYGVVAARGGVIALCAPDILYLADRDGDGKAEVRETLFTGFGVGEMWTRINNPRWGIDNWIYGVSGAGSGGMIQGPKLTKPVRIGAVCFRFKPDGSAFEPCSGRTSGFGQAMTDWGDRFLCTNQQHALLVAPLPYRYLVRNPYYAAAGSVENISRYGHPARVFPASQPHPWRMARSRDPQWVKFYGVNEATANGFFTAASGQTIYRAASFPPEFRGHHFSVDNAQNLIHRCRLERDGPGFAAIRAGEEGVEFLTSTERWFRPVNLTTGPDGALYVVDMYREIIEDYSAIPRYLQQQYGLIEGSERGRLWKIVADGSPGWQPPNLSEASGDELVDALSHTNAWWRQTAQRLLVERADRAVAGRLASLVRGGATPQTRLHALYTLHGLKALTLGEIEHALADPHYAVRTHALELAEPWLADRPAVVEKVLAMVADPDPRVRLQLGFTLGASDDPRAVDALAELGASDAAHPWMEAAILSSVATRADLLVAAILRRTEPPGESHRLLPPLASVVGARRDDTAIGNLLAIITQHLGSDAHAVQAACLEGLTAGLKRGKAGRPLDSGTGRTALRRLMTNPASDVRRLAVATATLVKLEKAPEMQASYARAVEIALDDRQSVLDRQLAASLLSGAPYEIVAPMVEKLLEARQPLDLQAAAVAVASSSSDPRVGPSLLDGWPGYTPKVQEAVLAALFSRTNRLPVLLEAIEAGTVAPSALSAIRREQLLRNANPEIRQEAESLLANRRITGRRAEVLDRFAAALKADRDAERGRAVYEKQCAKCHKLRDQGFSVGPDLATASTRSDETLLADVLDPSSQLTVGYQSYTVVTDAGQIFTGLLAAETATSITLRKEEGVDQTILRNQIDQMEASPLSMMPEELEKEVKPQEMADLIAYLREALGPVPPPIVVLFDDDPAFLDHLTQGEGTARLDRKAPFSGTACLVVTPPQRHGVRMPGWQYPIVETPGPGEFRYLRFAWRVPAGHGVMIEMAADGHWPLAEEPIRRYYAGRNTTGWKAVEVDENAPAEWVVVTRDLWRDFGSFTLTGLAPTALGGPAAFDRIELLRTLETPPAKPHAPSKEQ